ncbi:MAG: response regulator [Bradymonadia bacterium]
MPASPAPTHASTMMRLLIVEDEAVDAMLLKRAFSRTALNLEMSHVTDGDAAHQHLVDRDEDTLPHVILLDLNMPRLSGVEVLKLIKGDTRWQDITVVIFSSSRWDKEIDACFAAGATSYIEKPHDLEGYNQVVDVLEGFWMGDPMPRMLKHS